MCMVYNWCMHVVSLHDLEEEMWYWHKLCINVCIIMRVW